MRPNPSLDQRQQSTDGPAVRLGLAVITQNRIQDLRATVESLIANTARTFHLVIADDGSIDGSSSWARDHGIPVVGGRRRGVAWNKNRALYWLHQHLQCEWMFLFEDDVRPVQSGWEEPWLRGLRRHGHLTYAPPSWNRPDCVVGEYEGMLLIRNPGGPMMAFSRACVERAGYFDTRLAEYGGEHTEYSRRCARLGFGPGLDKGHLCIRDGKLSDHPTYDFGAQTAGRRARTIRNRAMMYEIELQPPTCTPVTRTGGEAAWFEHEQARARWPFAPRERVPGPLISVVCPTRDELLARRLVRSIAPEDQGLLELIWVTNAEETPNLPGKVVPFKNQPFSFAESVNHGVQYCSADLILIVHDDVRFTCSGWVARLRELFSAEAGLGQILGGTGSAESVTPLHHSHAPPWAHSAYAISRPAFWAMGGLEEALRHSRSAHYAASVRLARLGYATTVLSGWTFEHLGQDWGQTREVPTAEAPMVLTELGHQTRPPPVPLRSE